MRPARSRTVKPEEAAAVVEAAETEGTDDSAKLASSKESLCGTRDAGAADIGGAEKSISNAGAVAGAAGKLPVCASKLSDKMKSPFELFQLARNGKQVGGRDAGACRDLFAAGNQLTVIAAASCG